MILSLRSLIFRMFANPASADTLEDLGLSTGSFDSGQGTGAELVRLDDQGGSQLTSSEDLHGLIVVTAQAGGFQFLGSDDGGSLELFVDGAQVHDLDIVREVRLEAE